jgi:hypothetical protein
LVEVCVEGCGAAIEEYVKDEEGEESTCTGNAAAEQVSPQENSRQHELKVES